MNKRFMFMWAVWMGVTAGIYALLYSLTPLIQYGVMWASFVALPIYFSSGGKKEEIINYMCSSPCGVIWGVIFLKTTNLALQYVTVPTANMLATIVVTIVCVALHSIVLEKTWVNKVPAIFGGIAATLATSNYTPNGEHLIPLAITLSLGVILGYINNYGQFLLTEDGHWKIHPSKI